MHTRLLSTTTTRTLRWGLAFLFLGAIVALRFLIGPGYQPPPVSPALMAAEERWRSQQIEDYRVRVRMTYLNRPALGGEIEISVRGGRLESQECLSRTSSCHLFQWADDGIARLFELAYEGLDGEAGLVENCPQVAFDPRYGFPLRIDNARCANPEWDVEAGVVEVLSFTAIDPARSPAVAKGPVPADIATRWLRGQPCRLPCYERLVPGVTTAQEAFRDLRRHPLVGSVILTRYPSGNYGEIVWTWADGSAGGTAIFSMHDPEIVDSIRPSADPRVTLGEIIAAYGEPTDVVTTDFCASWGKARFYHLEFLNRSVGLYMRGPYKDVHRVHADLPIQNIIVYEPGSRWADFDYGYTKKEEINVSAWQSYQDFFFYSGTSPDKVCA